MNKHRVVEENAEKIWGWLKTRGGLAVWKSINLSNPGASWTGPVKDAEGNVNTKPNWQCENNPSRIITDPDEVEVSIPKEVKRFHVALRVGSQGLMIKLTDTSSERVRRECQKMSEKYSKESFYRFDYETQEAVIYIDDQVKPLSKYAKEKGWIKSETKKVYCVKCGWSKTWSVAILCPNCMGPISGEKEE